MKRFLLLFLAALAVVASAAETPLRVFIQIGRAHV